MSRLLAFPPAADRLRRPVRAELPEPPSDATQAARIIRRLERLAAIRPMAVTVVERLIDDVLAEIDEAGR